MNSHEAFTLLASIDPLDVACPVCNSPERTPCPQPQSRQRTIEHHTVRQILATYQAST